MTQDVAQLICEGACNGGLVQEFDRQVRGTRPVAVDGDVRMRLMDEETIELGRSLRHTEHAPTGVKGPKEMWACTACGFERVWGSNC